METISADDLDQLVVYLPGTLDEVRDELVRLMDATISESGVEVLSRDFREDRSVETNRVISALYAVVTKRRDRC